MMSEQEFEEWTIKLNLSDEAVKEIQRVRLAPPARRVESGKGNVSGNFASKKMNQTIQFESHLLELATIYELEYDDNVIEFYDQPTKIKLLYEINGKQRGVTKTADFFVIEKERAYWVECKMDNELIHLSQKNPERFYKDDLGWVYAPGKKYALEFGLDFLVKPSSSINWILQRNLRFLEDYLKQEHFVPNKDKDEIKTLLGQRGSIILSELIEADINIDNVYAMIISNEIYVNLSKDVLAEPEETKLYLNHSRYKSLSIIAKTVVNKRTNIISLEPGSSVIWGDEVWKIINKDEKKDILFLYCKSTNMNTEIPVKIFETYIASGYIDGINDVEAVNDDLNELIIQADEKDLEIANRKYEIVKHYLATGIIGKTDVTERTIRNWLKEYREAEELYSNGYVGLLPKIKQRGNREGKISLEAKALLEKMISEKYEDIKLKSAKAVYRELLVKSEEQNIIAPSYATFCKAIKNRSTYELTKSRKGKRAAYKHEEFYFYLDLTIPKHGDRVFEIAHIDHTELDIELAITKNYSARPWLTLMVDAYSRRILAYYLTFEPPSYRSCMMVIRQCVKNYNRLPNNIVIDGGKEFSSIYFDSLLALNEVNKKKRPPTKSRFGNTVERLFGITNALLIHNLKGNTQATKNVRQVTKSINPKNHAVWTLGKLDELFKNWIEKVYDNMEIKALFESPKEIFYESLKKSGSRPKNYISYNEAFILSTLPSPVKKTRLIQAGKGIKLTYVYYWCEEFRSPSVEGMSVPVKYDPFNMGIIYAYVNNKWLKCHAEEYKFLNGKTEKQLKIITEEIKRKRRLSSSNNNVTAKMIGLFILESEQIEDELALEKYKAPEIIYEDNLVEQVEQIEETSVSIEYSGDNEKNDADDEEPLEVFGELN